MHHNVSHSLSRDIIMVRTRPHIMIMSEQIIIYNSKCCSYDICQITRSLFRTVVSTNTMRNYENTPTANASNADAPRNRLQFYWNIHSNGDVTHFRCPLIWSRTECTCIGFRIMTKTMNDSAISITFTFAQVSICIAYANPSMTDFTDGCCAATWMGSISSVCYCSCSDSHISFHIRRSAVSILRMWKWNNSQHSPCVPQITLHLHFYRARALRTSRIRSLMKFLDLFAKTLNSEPNSRLSLSRYVRPFVVRYHSRES